MAKSEPSALERVVMVQEAQITAQAHMIAHLRKRVEALKLAFSDLLMLDMIDPNTGEVFRLIDFEAKGD